MENLELLVRELCKYKDELPWLEFKHNNYDPDMIGADISALANGATLDERNYAYFLWGVDDKSSSLFRVMMSLIFSMGLSSFFSFSVS